ncbi:hypothetical protein D0864_02493 [Hortaea werneckii]|uniref:FAD/NAD(P)-binding domain-containing protein n=1 Tax=Hortaea werneckii TaxID=91943 RepID=A0A3M7GW44_HORWE|nr:hypothetical protein KC323_g5856 [Hortaea werneckii]KAI6863937.1 hypothetical protein KC338_g5688 [Hortaea werneckii]RMZ00352.1 hypothetical protein D0862_06761 [Hortaea werneckii]RMZ05370.1 hypothetical protein D0864_02493 [Hortaea werneckii]
MSETRNIVVLGTSFGGLSIAHYLLKHTFPKLQQAQDVKYALHLVDPSDHFWWHIGAPREIVSVKEMKHSDCFVPTMDCFKQYSNFKDAITFHHGTATALDTEARNVSIDKYEGGSETIDYYALVIATGVRSPTPLTTLQGNYTTSQQALEELNTKLASAKEIVISGGGPVGVETAGEIGTHLGGKANITLIAGSDKLLPVLRKSLSDKAQRQLEKLGVQVKFGTKVTGADSTSEDGKTEVQLDNGEKIAADVYIPAFGVQPNTEFLPEKLKGSGGYVATNGKTLRVDAAGPRVYAAGDVSAVDKGGVLNLYSSIPVLGANVSHDLLSEAGLSAVPEKSYVRKDGETQLVPVGPKTGVGAFNGWQMPGFAVSMIKGKDYMLKNMGDITEGKKWVKA